MVTVSEFVDAGLLEAAAPGDEGAGAVGAGAGSCLLQADNRMPRAAATQIFNFIISEWFDVLDRRCGSFMNGLHEVKLGNSQALLGRRPTRRQVVNIGGNETTYRLTFLRLEVRVAGVGRGIRNDPPQTLEYPPTKYRLQVVE